MSVAGSAVDPQALLCALILAPQTFSRNRFYGMFEQPELARTRRRAARVRGMIRQLSGQGKHQAELLGEHVLEDGRVLIRYRIADLGFCRSSALSPLEAAALRYALHRAQRGPLSDEDRELVQQALARLNRSVPLDA